MKSLNGNKQMKDVFIGSCIKKSEKIYVYHPTQKPIYLLEKIILSSTDENDWILDPFSGSGTTNVVSARLNRNSVGIESDENYFEIMKKRISKENTQCILKKEKMN